MEKWQNSEKERIRLAITNLSPIKRPRSEWVREALQKGFAIWERGQEHLLSYWGRISVRYCQNCSQWAYLILKPPSLDWTISWLSVAKSTLTETARWNTKVFDCFWSHQNLLLFPLFCLTWHSALLLPSCCCWDGGGRLTGLLQGLYRRML